MSVRLIFNWQEFWIGARWDRRSRTLQVMLVPALGLAFAFTEDDYDYA